MTSSWFLRLGALQMIQDGSWKREHDFLIVIQSNFLFVMHGFRGNEVSLQARYDVIVISSLGGASSEFLWRILEERPWLPDSMHGFRDIEVLMQPAYDVIVISPLAGASDFFHDGLWKSERDFLIVFLDKFLSEMHGFRDDEVLLKAGYDVSVISPLVGVSGNFSWRILKDDHDFLVAFYTNFLSRMHGFRDNEVLLPTRYDVIVISPQGGASGNFSWRILKERPWPADSVPY